MPAEGTPASEPMLSRGGAHSPLGALLGELKTKVDHDTEIAFRQLCNQAGTDVSGALRNWVYLRVHGKTFDEMCFDAMKRRAEVLFPEGPNRDMSILPVRQMGGRA